MREIRSRMLLGDEAMARLRRTRIIVFGIGGVGSWCVEALVRTGARRLTVVDSDNVEESNCNRQLVATTRTIGRPKVEVLRDRVLELNPEAEVTALQRRYTEETAQDFCLADYDYVIDCIDSVRDKARLIINTLRTEHTVLFSSMGAALRFDPTMVTTAEFRKVEGDALARALRQHFKRWGTWPERRFRCVFSRESSSHNIIQADGNGSLMPVTATFGMTLASLLLGDLREA